MDRGKVKFSIKYSINSIRNTFNPSPITNIYHASVQKTGSQWIKDIFNDPKIRNKTRLTTYPQHRYEWDEFQKKFPENCFVPGLYLSYQSYEEIVKPVKYKTLYVCRDPRDLIVSWYYSMKYSHGLMGKVFKHRKNLQKMSEENGISYCIKHFQLKLSFIKDWFLNCDDTNVIFLRLEDLVKNPVGGFSHIFNECNIDISKKDLEQVMQNYTKEKMRERENRDKEMSHYRNNGKTWEELFTKEHLKLFNNLNGNIIDLLGYET
jgi:hypothetical protein